MTSIFSSYLHEILPGLQDLKQVRSGDMKLTWKSVDLKRKILRDLRGVKPRISWKDQNFSDMRWGSITRLLERLFLPWSVLELEKYEDWWVCVLGVLGVLERVWESLWVFWWVCMPKWERDKREWERCGWRELSS